MDDQPENVSGPTEPTGDVSWADRPEPDRRADPVPVPEPDSPEPDPSVVDSPEPDLSAEDGLAATSIPIRHEAKRAIEAMVMVAEQPLAPHLLGQLLELSPVVVDALCRELVEAYEADDRGFQLIRVAGGWRYQSHPDQQPYVERLVLEGQSSRLSAAALETLAIVAYKQPVSRAQVASIRGVSVDGVMRTLEQRAYIVQVGRDPGPGQAVMYGTTQLFLEKLGLDSLTDLAPLGDFVPSAHVVEQLERGLRPDREALTPEDFLAVADDASPGSNGHGLDDDEYDLDPADEALDDE